MAKKIVKKENVVEIETDFNTDVDNEVENVEIAEAVVEVEAPVIENVEITKDPIQKNVKVTVSKNHRCKIGGVHYSFIANEEQTVPENVKKVLKQANLLVAI